MIIAFVEGKKGNPMFDPNLVESDDRQEHDT
jgi:hypothetical protein